MKKHLLLILMIALFVYSCKKSNNAPATVVGTWYVKTDSTTSQGSPLNVNYYDLSNNYQFNADGTGRRNFNGGSNFTYKVVSGTLYLYYSAYTSGTTTVAASNDTCDIATLTATKLSLVSSNITITPGLGTRVLVTEYQFCSK